MTSYENIYWTFSAAAQSVAAFVALLIAGYAVVLSMMESAAQTDKTLIEIHDALKEDYHRTLSLLAIITAFSIITCLSVVYFNKSYLWWNIWLERIAVMFTISSIAGGVYFIINIIDPRKYKKKADILSDELKPKSEVGKISRSNFFIEFVELEQLIRQLWEDRIKQEEIKRRQSPPAVREMIEDLSSAEIIPFNVYERLLLVNRYRNLVFHGHVQELDQHVIEEVRTVKEAIRRLTTG